MVGTADLPLHKGKVPTWMLRLMERMSLAVLEAIVEIKGPESVINGLSDPFWFQAFNNIIGMDWDSSGSTTVLLGILKTITWKRPDLGILVIGGKGEKSRKVPEEADIASKIFDVDPDKIKIFSKLAARADSAFLQDGYSLYHHAVILSEKGSMVVVQQGMNPERKMARRYHIDKFSIEEPHSGVAGEVERNVLNATAKESRDARKAYLDLIYEGSNKVLRMLSEANRILRGSPSLEEYLAGNFKRKVFKRNYKPVLPTPQLRKALEDLSNFSPTNEVELALAPSLGPKVVRALALVADLIMNVPTSSKDPVTHPIDPYLYSYAVGGKDGVPYPYDRKTAMRVIMTLEEAVNYAKIGNKEKLKALIKLKRLTEKLKWVQK